MFTTSKHGPNQKIITIIRAAGVGLLTFIAYGIVTDYLGYRFSRVEASDAAIPVDAVEHRVTRIVDGDTVYTKDGTKIRLHGIDTPERDQPYGKQATRALNKLIKTKIFEIWGLCSSLSAGDQIVFSDSSAAYGMCLKTSIYNLSKGGSSCELYCE